MKSEEMLKKSCSKLGIPYLPPVAGATQAEDNERIKLLRRRIADQRGKLLCTAKLTDRLHKKRLSRQMMRNRVMPGMQQIIQNMQHQSAASLLAVPPTAHIAFPQMPAAHYLSNPRSGLQLVPSTNTSVATARTESKAGDESTDKGPPIKLPPKSQSDETTSGPATHLGYDARNVACYPVGDESHPAGLSLLGSALNSNPGMVGALLRASPPASARRHQFDESSEPKNSNREPRMAHYGAPPKKRVKVSGSEYPITTEPRRYSGSSSEESSTRLRVE